MIVIKILKALWQDFTAKRVINAASQLTYSTILATVPIAAVVFAIARGFGYSKYIETWFRGALTNQPQAADTIIHFVNSYLVHTKSGVVFGIGLVFMLWTVLMLTHSIEQVFNDIWNVRKQRKFVRSITDYLAIFLLLPILIIVTSGVTLWMTTISKIVNEMFVIGPLVKLCIDAIPFVILTCVIGALYTFLPNTKVKFKSVILPSILASVSMELLQYFYVHSQIWVSSYNAIYGSFAALPLFMLWVQISWTIILIGAELSYTKQNLEDFRFNSNMSQMSERHHLLLAAILMSRICKRFKDGHAPYSAQELKFETGLPMRIVNEIIYELLDTRLLMEVNGEDTHELIIIPAESVENITVGMLISRMESLHPWALNIPLNIKERCNSPKWKKAMLMRHNYLKAQRDIKLYEL